MVEIYRKNRSDDAIPGGKFFCGAYAPEVKMKFSVCFFLEGRV